MFNAVLKPFIYAGIAIATVCDAIIIVLHVVATTSVVVVRTGAELYRRGIEWANRNDTPSEG